MNQMDRYERDAYILPFRKAGAREDLIAAAVDESRSWKEIMGDIHAAQDPTALMGFAGLEFQPQTSDSTLVTGNATEQAIWPVTQTPIPGAGSNNALAVTAPKLYRIFASGTSTTAASPGTYSLRARIGNANTSPLMGAASGNLTPVASATAAQWKLLGFLYVRSLASAAANAVGSFEFNHSGTVGGGGPVSATGNAIFGGLSAATDFTLTTNGLYIGVVHATSTTNTWTPQFVGWGSWS